MLSWLTPKGVAKGFKNPPELLITSSTKIAADFKTTQCYGELIKDQCSLAKLLKEVESKSETFGNTLRLRHTHTHSHATGCH